MCQMASPPWGMLFSNPVFWRFSTSKYSPLGYPALMRKTVGVVSTCGAVKFPGVMTVGVTQPNWLLHQALKCGGCNCVLSKPHEFAIIQYEPMPSLVLSV